MSDQYWNYIVTFVGLVGFYLGGKKIWWAWYVNIANQVLWLAFGFATHQWGFVVGTFFYTPVFVRNAYLWTKEHKQKKELAEKLKTGQPVPFFSVAGTISREDFGGPDTVLVKDATISYAEADAALTTKLHDIVYFREGRRYRWFGWIRTCHTPLRHRRRICRCYRRGIPVGKIDNVELGESGLSVKGTIDTTTPEGRAIWDHIKSPMAFSIADDMDYDKPTKSDQGILTPELKEEARRALLAYNGVESDGCQATTTWQGREVECEVNVHPVNFEHQHILTDGMPPLIISWLQDERPSAEELPWRG